MNTRYRVFLGAPSSSPCFDSSYSWHTLNTSKSSSATSSQHATVYPPATLEAASRRISLLYQNVIFNDLDQDGDGNTMEPEAEVLEVGNQLPVRPEQTTMITWDPTTQFESQSRFKAEASTFLRASPSRLQIEAEETQEGTSYNYSDASSIARFPDFHFNLHALTSLSTLKSGKGSRKVNVLLAVLEVDGPDSITLRKGADAGKDIYVLKMILGDEDNVVCKLTAWREVAEAWGGVLDTVAVRRGDILYLENVSAVWEDGSAIALTASPHLKSKAEICYRSMPRAAVPEDDRLRPDLRLGYSDAAVRRVSAVVGWFERMAGLAS
ncbi:hypothetical protein BV25DRAFT_1814042 [Artomyces pyxidatus]|uniref:Uncharacterized protein n=1 Tax=Artomyces pyxidatus TaxID=48021 RepID=A0ACB8SKI2_9AGAM|nr:hypothetical protein BV25DRAFT_1814042 [Artomyces pyxidatus]